jgi:glycosyltransferase involved in cell wall biosynthesis
MKPATPSRDSVRVVVNARRLAGPRSGTEIYMEQLLLALGRTQPAEVVACTCEPLVGEIAGRVEERLLPLHGLRSRDLISQVRKLWFDQWGCLKGLRGREPLLFHGLDGLIPLSLRRADSAVVTVHDMATAVHPELFDRRTRMLYRLLWPHILGRADRIIAVSRCTADDLMRLGRVPASRIEIVYAGIDPIFTDDCPAPTPPVSGPYLLAVGGVSPRKNTRRLIQAFTRWRAGAEGRSIYRLLITGTSLDPEFTNGRGTVPEGVEVLGYVDRRKLRGLFAGAQAFLYPALYEGFGLPILEAMASGVPVVTSRTGSAPEVAGGAAILVDPFDVESIAEGIELTTNPDEAARLRALGCARAREFSWEKAAAETFEVYRALGR